MGRGQHQRRRPARALGRSRVEPTGSAGPSAVRLRRPDQCQCRCTRRRLGCGKPVWHPPIAYHHSRGSLGRYPVDSRGELDPPEPVEPPHRGRRHRGRRHLGRGIHRPVQRALRPGARRALGRYDVAAVADDGCRARSAGAARGERNLIRRRVGSRPRRSHALGRRRLDGNPLRPIPAGNCEPAAGLGMSSAAFRNSGQRWRQLGAGTAMVPSPTGWT
jgi:hypothetical protein